MDANGLRDTNWSTQVPGAGGLAIQPDGKVLVCGLFSSVCGQPRSCLARLNLLTPADHQLFCDAGGATWLRGGSSPELTGVAFDISSDGTNWTNLGPGARVTGGWRLDTAAFSLNEFVRARGFASGGRWNGSLSLVQEISQLTTQTSPLVISSNASFGVHSNGFSFTVQALVGQSVVVDATTNLTDWVPVQTNLVIGPTQFIFVDPQPGNLPRRFYRAKPSAD